MGLNWKTLKDSSWCKDKKIPRTDSLSLPFYFSIHFFLSYCFLPFLYAALFLSHFAYLFCLFSLFVYFPISLSLSLLSIFQSLFPSAVSIFLSLPSPLLSFHLLRRLVCRVKSTCQYVEVEIDIECLHTMAHVTTHFSSRH